MRRAAVATSVAAAGSGGGRGFLIPSSATYSTFSGFGAGSGRGRGRGSGGPSDSSPTPRVPGQPADSGPGDEDPFIAGRGRGAAPVSPSAPIIPFFLSSSAVGRGRGRGVPPAEGDGGPPKPIFFKREDASPVAPDESPAPLARPFSSPSIKGSGRGKSIGPPETVEAPGEENRHVRRRAQPSAPAPLGKPKIDRGDAVRQAMQVLGRNGPGGRRGRGRRDGPGRSRSRPDDRNREDDESEELQSFLGNNADGERFERELGPERMKIVEQVFEQVTDEALPSLLDEAYLEALHLNNSIEYEPEYHVNFENPDIDEKPPMPLQEVLEKARPFLFAYTGMKSQEEWEEAMEDLRERLPYLNELVEVYCGPGIITAKQQQEHLKKIVSTLPENVPSSVKRFTDRAFLSLQSNPGWKFEKKYQFMDKLVREVKKHYEKR